MLRFALFLFFSFICIRYKSSRTSIFLHSNVFYSKESDEKLQKRINPLLFAILYFYASVVAASHEPSSFTVWQRTTRNFSCLHSLYFANYTFVNIYYVVYTILYASPLKQKTVGLFRMYVTFRPTLELPILLIKGIFSSSSATI